MAFAIVASGVIQTQDGTSVEIDYSPCDSETEQKMLEILSYTTIIMRKELYGRYMTYFSDGKDTRERKFTLPALKKNGLDINDSKGSHITM